MDFETCQVFAFQIIGMAMVMCPKAISAAKYGISCIST
jgi:hypothetical protein